MYVVESPIVEQDSPKTMWFYIFLWNFKLKNNIFNFKAYLIKLI